MIEKVFDRHGEKNPSCNEAQFCEQALIYWFEKSCKPCNSLKNQALDVKAWERIIL